jgi:hypothetical protein
VTDFGTTFEQFLLWERASRDTLEVKRTYVDMAGDLVAGLVLSQIVYWHLPNREGKARLRVEREGELWLAKARAEWWDECRISPKQADRALDVLQARGLIEVRLFKFGPAPTKHIRIRRDGFLHAWKAQLVTNGEGPEHARHIEPEMPEVSRSILTKGENPIRPKGEMDFPEKARSLTETTTEITTAAPASDSAHGESSTAAAALIGELVSHGVSRSAARRLARGKPEVCRRCLEYLPYAIVKTTKGTWLANAIEHEFGPPEAYEKAMAQRAREEQARKRALRQNACKARQEARSDRKAARLRERYRQMEKEKGEAYRAFAEHLERQRARAAQFAGHLSEAGRQQYLAAFDTTERRLEIFEDWLGRCPSPEHPLASPGPGDPTRQAGVGTEPLKA